MTMTFSQTIITIAVVIAGTMLTRFLPFLLLPEGKNPPRFISWLSDVLPPSAIGLLLVYCLKDVGSSPSAGIPELLSITLIVLLHLWKKNTLLSIASGTIFYMFLVQSFF